MDNINFNTLEELYVRISPALNVKQNELRRLGIKYIKKEDIWNYLIDFVWRDKNNLTLSEMVDDIINADNSKLDKFVKVMIENSHRDLNFETKDIL